MPSTTKYRVPERVRFRYLLGVDCRWKILRAVCLVLASCPLRAGAEEASTQIYVVGHGWHTGLILPLADVDLDLYPGLRPFADWDYVEIGWGDEGFYRGGDAISLPVALAAVFTPTPTVLHVVGVPAPVEEAFPGSELISAEIDREDLLAMVRFVDATFQRVDGKTLDLGEGIYGISRFYRAEGFYYFPNTCNVWTLKALNAGGFPVVPWAGIRTENVMNQVARQGTTIRRYPGRSRLSVGIAAGLALVIGWQFRKGKVLVPSAWALLVVAAVTIATITMLNVNKVSLPDWLPSAAAFACWLAVALVAFAHVHAMRERPRWRHFPSALLASTLIVMGLSPL